MLAYSGFVPEAPSPKSVPLSEDLCSSRFAKNIVCIKLGSTSGLPLYVDAAAQLCQICPEDTMRRRRHRALEALPSKSHIEIP